MDEEQFHDRIWNEFEIFLYKDGRNPTRLHLPLEQDNQIPYCYDEIEKLNYTFREKSVQTFPPGWRDICVTCLENWVENHD